MADRIELGKRYHCRELNTSKHRTGIFYCDKDNMEVKLFDYDDFYCVEDGPLYLQLEDNHIVSMHGIVPKGPGHSSYMGDPPATTYFSGAIANVTVVGNRQWTNEDAIRRTWFSIPHTKSLLAHEPRLKAIRAKRFPPDAIEKPLFEISESGLIVRCWYVVRGSWEFGSNDWEPLFEIEYSTAQSLDTYLQAIHIVLQFFSASAGFLLTPSKISISPLTHGESQATTDWRKNEEFSVEYHWSEAIVETHDLHPLNSFAFASDRGELAALKLCLRAWIKRSEPWLKATTLMMGSSGL